MWLELMAALGAIVLRAANVSALGAINKGSFFAFGFGGRNFRYRCAFCLGVALGRRVFIPPIRQGRHIDPAERSKPKAKVKDTLLIPALSDCNIIKRRCNEKLDEYTDN